MEQLAHIKSIFPGLEPELLQQLTDNALFKEVKEGETIISTGQYIRSTMLLLDGLIKVYREDDEGNEFLMYYLEPGEACALSILCAAQQEKSEIMAKAVKDSTLMMVPVEQTEIWMNQFKSWYRYVVGTYRARFEELLQTLDSIAFKSLDERLLFYLKRHLDISGPRIELSHQQIAEELNSSREVISRLLKKLEQRGLVVLHRNVIEIPHPDKLIKQV
jgi:CRP/FNR family transcriptional regulator, anaerobic regulatory protein